MTDVLKQVCGHWGAAHGKPTTEVDDGSRRQARIDHRDSLVIDLFFCRLFSQSANLL